jgi:hypothetical protein
VTNEIIDVVRAVAPLGTGAVVLTIIMLLRKRPEPGSALDVLTEHFEFVLARRRALKAGHGRQKAYELAKNDLAERRKAREQIADVVPINPKRRKLPGRRARDPDQPA